MNRFRAFAALTAVGLLASTVCAGTVVKKTFQSQALSQTVTYWLYRPANYDQEVAAGKKFSVIYLMHWWLYKAEGWHVQDQYRRNPHLDQCIDSVADIICAAPQDMTQGPSGTGTSWWVDSPKQPTWKYSSLIYQDMVNEVEATNATLHDRSHRGLCGPSMGGYGTLHNLRVHSDVFSVGYAIVPLTDLAKHLGGTVCEYGTCQAMTYDASLDPMKNVSDFKTKDVRLAFHTGHCVSSAPACAGTAFPTTCAELNCMAGADFFNAECVAFDQALTAAGVAHTFADFANDGHEYPDPAKMVMILKFFAQNFGTTSVSQPAPSSRGRTGFAVNKVRLTAQVTKSLGANAGYVGINGKRLRTLPASGIVVEVK